MDEHKHRLPTQAIIALIGLCFTVLVTLLTLTANTAKDYTQTKDDVKYVRIAIDSLRGVPENIRILKADMGWMKDSASSNNLRIALLERTAEGLAHRVHRLEVPDDIPPIDGTSIEKPSHSPMVASSDSLRPSSSQ